MQNSRYSQGARASIVGTSFGAGPIDVIAGPNGQKIRGAVYAQNTGNIPITVKLHFLYFTHGSQPTGSYDAPDPAIPAPGAEATLAVGGAAVPLFAITPTITSGYFAGTDIDALVVLLNTDGWAIVDSLTIEHAVHIVTAAPPPPTVSADIIGTPTFTAI